MEFSELGTQIAKKINVQRESKASASDGRRFTVTQLYLQHKLGCALLLHVLAESCVGSYHPQTSERCLSVVVRGCIARQAQNLIKFIDLRCCYLSEKTTRECE